MTTTQTVNATCDNTTNNNNRYTVYTAHGGIGDAFRGIRIFNRDFDKIDHYRAGQLRTAHHGELHEGQWHLVTVCHKRPRVGRATAEVRGWMDGWLGCEGACVGCGVG